MLEGQEIWSVNVMFEGFNGGAVFVETKVLV